MKNKLFLLMLFALTLTSCEPTSDYEATITTTDKKVSYFKGSVRVYKNVSKKVCLDATVKEMEELCKYRTYREEYSGYYVVTEKKGTYRKL